MKKIIGVVVLLVSIAFGDASIQSTIDGAENFDKGIKAATEQGDNKKAIHFFEKAAKQGNSNALNMLGFFYSGGPKDVKQDDKKAFMYYKKAAEYNNTEAIYAVGLMYSQGKGVKQDDKKAIKWLKRASKEGDPNATFRLGMIYIIGQGIKADKTIGCEYIKKSKALGRKKYVEEALNHNCL